MYPALAPQRDVVRQVHDRAIDADDDFRRSETDGRFDESDSRPSNSDRSNERDRSDEQSRRINDTRIVSDADPGPIRPGQRYAQLDKIADAAGKPCYEPGGHHCLPKAIYKNGTFDNATICRTGFKT